MNALPPVRRTAFWSIAIALIGCLGAAVWVWSRPDAETLFEQALPLLSTDPAKSEQLLSRAIAARQGNYPNAQMALCCTLASQKKWDQLEPLFGTLDQSAVRSDLLLRFGSLAHGSEHRSLAIDALEIVRRRNDKWSDPALVKLVALYQETARQVELIDALKERTSRNPADLGSWFQLIQSLNGASRDAECLEVIRDALGHDLPAEFRSELEYRLIEQLVAVGNKEQARDEISRLQAAGDQSVRLSTLDVEVCRQEGRLDEALELANSIFPQLHQNPSAYLARGAILLDLGQYDAAVLDFEQCVQQQPANERAHFKLAEAYRLAGQSQKAMQHRDLAERLRSQRLQLNELLKQYSDSPSQQLRDELAALYAELGEDASSQFWRQPPSK